MLKFPSISLTGVHGIMIDIDDTLYAYQPCHTQAISACYQLFNKEFPSILSDQDFLKKYKNQRNAVTKRLFSHGACRSRGLAFMGLFEELEIPIAYVHAMKYEALYWKIFIKNMKVEQAAENLLKSAQKSHIPVCIVSDMQMGFQVQKIRKLGLEKYMTYMVTSEEVGSEKPHPKIFEYALRKLQTTPEKTIMIGDSLEKDILGAKACGITAYQVEVYDKPLSN